MSMDQGFLPEEFAEVMTQAQYSVPPINKALVRTIIKRELGDYPEKIFAKFDAEAFAAAIYWSGAQGRTKRRPKSGG